MSEIITRQGEKMLTWYDRYRDIFTDRRITLLAPQSKYQTHQFHDHIFSDKIIGLATGQAQLGIIMSEQFFCLDFDSEAAYGRWLAANPAYEWTARAKTPSGYHVLFQVTDANNAPRSGKGAEVSVIADGWHIAVYPSVHPCGQVYEWINEPWGIYTVQNIDVVLGGIDRDKIEWNVPDYGYNEYGEAFDEWE